MTIIRAEGLRKSFFLRRHHRGRWALLRNLVAREGREVRAVDGIDLSVEAGEMVGYLGPNGAGKSTTIKMLTGLLVPSGGTLEVNGFVPWKNRRPYVAGIGAVFGQRTTLWWDLPVIESLELLRHVYRVPAQRFHSNLENFTELLELDEFLDAPVRTLSLGQRMRADIAAALLHDPPLLFLDEPTIGLDVIAKERIRRFIRHVHGERGTTVILTTHDLAEVEKLCRRIVIIDRGRLLFDGPLQTLQERFGGRRRLEVEFAETYADADIDGAELVERDAHRVVYAFDRQRVTASELIGRLTARFSVRDLSVTEPDLETTIRDIYENDLLSRESS